MQTLSAHHTPGLVQLPFLNVLFVISKTILLLYCDTKTLLCLATLYYLFFFFLTHQSCILIIKAKNPHAYQVNLCCVVQQVLLFFVYTLTVIPLFFVIVLIVHIIWLLLLF